ncbi:MAG TPA: LysR family transcriptional regulator [Polyangiaceae bacterium]|jgi:hypothetical protein|nr:LysR family transcriptional regulator [Polyangiaceae bacterium]
MTSSCVYAKRRLNLPELQRSFRFDELGVLVAVAEAGSLSAAAKQLGVPKSTVGRAIAWKSASIPGGGGVSS